MDANRIVKKSFRLGNFHIGEGFLNVICDVNNKPKIRNNLRCNL